MVLWVHTTQGRKKMCMDLSFGLRIISVLHQNEGGIVSVLH